MRIALAYKGVAYEYVAVNLLRAAASSTATAYRALNPMAQVPTLVLDDGRHALSQSMAILEYLEETVPAPSLLPTRSLPARAGAAARRDR